MGCFGCFEPQAVEDEPQVQKQYTRKTTAEQNPASPSPTTSSSAAPPPANSSVTHRKAGVSPVPSVSSQDSRDRAPLLLRGSPQLGTTPLTATGSASTAKVTPGGPALGRRPGTAGGQYEGHSVSSQDSLAGPAGSNSQQPWHQENANQQQQLHYQQDLQRGSLGPPQRPPSRDAAPHHPQRIKSRDGSQSPAHIIRASSATERETGAEPQRTGSKGRPASSAGVRAPTAEEKTLQPHEPMPQPQAPLGSIPDHLGAPIAATTFSLRELERATGNFSPKNFVGEGGFGRVFKGKLESTGQVVAVKQLDLNGLQGNREFLVEVLMLSLLHHPNLVQLIGYCADGDQRLLVYEFMANGALEDHLHDLPENKEALDWNTRMRVAAGAAKGLEYLHDKANPPVIYRDFKSSNILLDETWHPKLSDFGLAKLGPVGDKTHVSTRVMGTYGYCAPEYAMTGQLTVKSDVYSFGVVLLELITGRKAIDSTRPTGEHNLVTWARPLFKDRRKFPAMADPLLQGRYPMRGLYQALAVAAMCLQEQAAQRPMIHDVVTALSYLAAQPFDPNAPQQPRFAPGTPQHELGRDRRGSRSPQVRGMTGASPRASPAHMAAGLGHHSVRRGWDAGPGSPSLGPLGATSSLRGYRESPGRGGLSSGRSTPVHPMARAYGENVNPNSVPAQVVHE